MAAMLADSCIFCKIIKGVIPCFKVFENAHALAFMDINPIALGHILVIPKFHGERLHDVPSEYLAETLPVISKIARAAFGEEGIAYNVLQNNGREAHQEVDHVHFHIIPKRTSEGDASGLGVAWPLQPSIGRDQLAAFASGLADRLK